MLEKLLASSAYEGRSKESSSGAHYTLPDLFSRVQASPAEISNELRRMNAIEINGVIRLLSRRTGNEVIRQLLDTILEQELPLTGFKEELIIGQCPEWDCAVIRHLLSTMGEQLNGLWIMDARRVAAISANLLLQSTNGVSMTSLVLLIALNNN